MTQLTIPQLPAGGFDWPSLGFAFVLALITFACLWIKHVYPRIETMGATARVVANLAIGYFGFGMVAFGASCAVRAYMPVPGGTAWQGPVAVIGGLAAVVVGGTTLVEHAVQLAALRRASLPQPVPVAVRSEAT